MIRLSLAFAITVAAPFATPVHAQGVFVPPPPGIVGDRPELTGKHGRVAREMRHYGFDVDATRLSNQQISLIDSALHDGRSVGDTQARIRAVLRGGFLQRIIDKN
ncbi:hypothetical protein SAMN05444004_103151 [Jannaschia faecimaris]|uniref:Uncharacterized protein n=1 Tax=Jannaschia faecimaris TaxID=1244108 RepID=A0A1H3MS14_9RHOB|nr:hypothetical protein [Jannaschia faecimaris]SDY79280.1 hypothetical protein SAMN05444004_103151 [Jannaschia faecimaris]